MNQTEKIVKPHAYSQGITGMRIGIVGITPPPLGGISVHIQRITGIFQRQYNTVFTFDSEKRARGLVGFLVHEFRLITFFITHKPHIVYHHTLTCFFRGRLFELFLVICLKKIVGCRVVMVDHVSRFFAAQSWVYKKCASLLLRGLDQQVLIGSSTYASYKNQKIFLGDAVSIEEAFLPPDMQQESTIVATHPSAVYAFLQSHRPVLLANASKLVRYTGCESYGGQDLYGFDMCLAVFPLLKKQYPHMGLILVLAHAGDQQSFTWLKKTIEKNESVYLMYQCSSELWPLLKRVDLFLRPTLSDGASVSVQEALYLGTPVVASDVCERPAGTVLFRAGDQEDLIRKITNVLSEHEAINVQRDNSHAQQTV